jgi:isochorismate synthase EntC
VRDTAVRLLLYSEKPMHASPVQGSSLHAMPKTALDGFVSRATAEPIVYGHAGIPDDCKRQVSAADKKADVQQDPTVLHAVIEELQEQRDSIASFARAELAGEIDPQLEALRLTNRELRAKVDPAQLVPQLHPTPAVGCLPRDDAALAKLREYREQLKVPGFFGAPFGFIEDDGSTHVVVAIRGICWQGDTISLPSGCGIVGGSAFDHEWRELRLKREAVLRLLALHS